MTEIETTGESAVERAGPSAPPAGLDVQLAHELIEKAVDDA